MLVLGVTTEFLGIYIISVMFQVASALKSSQVWILELNIPKVLKDSSLDRSAGTNSYQRDSAIQTENSNFSPENYIIKVVSSDSQNMVSTISDLFRRRVVEKAMLEEGPGAFKSERIHYPEKYLQNRLKVLLMLKKRNEERAQG